jgi:hypothetical protein
MLPTKDETDFMNAISELKSLGIKSSKLNRMNDSDEIENLVDNIKQECIRSYQSNLLFTD